MIVRSRRARAGAFFVACVALVAFGACSPAGGGSASSGAAVTAVDDDDTEAAREVTKPAPRLSELGPNARRVTLLVLPGDASVEVDGAPVRRRDGVVELTGDVGKVDRVRVLKGAQSLDREVTIPAEGSPPLIDLNARAVGVAGGSTMAGEATTPTQKEHGANPLLQDENQ